MLQPTKRVSSVSRFVSVTYGAPTALDGQAALCL
jgi:hypothetical protein